MKVPIREIRKVKLVECPRDAMQGWSEFIPTKKKAEYLNALLQVGFDSLDFGSFVSPRAIPQMADTKLVIENLVIGHSKTRLLAIAVNTRGAEEAARYPFIQDIGFPFSISETFQQRNAHADLAHSVKTVSHILEICKEHDKRMVIYISMAFGNPYGDDWSPVMAVQWIDKLVKMGACVISLADTVGLATPEQVFALTESLITEFPQIESGVHLHSRREHSSEKLEAAFNAGCRRFDGALNGIGGCPMAGDELVGNMDSLMMIEFFRQKEVLPELNEQALEDSLQLSNELFINH